MVYFIQNGVLSTTVVLSKIKRNLVRLYVYSQAAFPQKPCMSKVEASSDVLMAYQILYIVLHCIAIHCTWNFYT